jgi:hypothetical protein
MSGARTGKTLVYSLEYIENFSGRARYRGLQIRRRSRAVGWSLPDRLLPQNEVQQPIIRVSSLSLHSLFMLDHHTMFTTTNMCGNHPLSPSIRWLFVKRGTLG